MEMTLDEVYKRLDLAGKDCLVRKNDNWQERVEFPSRIKRLLEKNDALGAFDAFFCFDNKPLIMFYEDPRDMEALHKAIWNFNETPVVIVVDQADVRIYNGFRLLEGNGKKVLECFGDETKLQDFQHSKLVAGETWNRYADNLDRESRVDRYLLKNIDAVIGKLCNECHVERGLANALVGKIIFIRYLIDRKVRLHFNNNPKYWSNKDLCALLSDKRKFARFISYLQSKDIGFNGDLFTMDESTILSMPDGVFEILIRMLKSDDIENGQQVLFDMYDFSVLPIEFISNVYEKFIGKENQAKSGAYYTPTFLVDYIVRETVTESLGGKVDWNCKVLDPACGSGIFLVESLRKMIEKCIQETGGTKSNRRFKQVLSDIVTNNIFGIDKDKSAVQVAIFSIYLTLLDYQTPADIEHFKFPNLLGTNLICANAFDSDDSAIRRIEAMVQGRPFDCIIGNPPWLRGGGRMDSTVKTFIKRNRESKFPIADNEIAQAFLVRGLEFATSSTLCAFVVTSKVLYNDNSKDFRASFLAETLVEKILELSSVRHEVFNVSNKCAIAPACVIFYKRALGQDTDKNIITHISVKPSLSFTLFKVFSLTRHDIQQVQQNRLKTYDWLWKVLVYGSYLDFLFIKQLKDENRKIGEVIGDKVRFVCGTGIQFSKTPKYSAAHLKGRDFIDAEAIDNFIIDDSKIAPFKGGSVHRLRSQKNDIFEAPMLLCRKGLDSINLTLRSAVSMRNLLFKDSLTAIKAYREADVVILRNIAGLGASDLFTYFAINTFTSVGIEREQFHHGDLFKMPYCDGLAKIVEGLESQEQLNKDLLGNYGIGQKVKSSCVEEINSAVIATWNVSKAETDLIDYALTVIRPMIVIGHRAEKKLRKDDNLIKAYVDVFLERFSAVFEDGINRFFYDAHVDEAWIGIRFYISRKPDGVNFSDKKWINFLDKIASGSITDRLFVKKDIRGFERNGFYIIKPNMNRLWHPAIARLDVEEFSDAMVRTGGMK